MRMSQERPEAQTVRVMSLMANVSHILRAHQKAKELYVNRFAPDYSVFTFIEPDELRLSKIVAWLLDPDQTHGQCGLFLRLLLQVLGVEARFEDCRHASVRTEVPVRDGRMDVFVSMPGFQLAIENKPWARDQHEQLKRYFTHFDALRPTNYQIIYLTAKGTYPSSLCPKEADRRVSVKQLRLWGYDSEVLAWLARCQSECRADRVSIFIDEFSRYIRATFAGLKDRTMSDHLLEEITGSAENVEAAMLVFQMADPLRKRLLSDLQKQLEDKLPGQKVQVIDNPWAKYSGITIGFSDESPYSFKLRFQNQQFNGLDFGISRNVERSAEHTNEYDVAVRSLGPAPPSNDTWLWSRAASRADPLFPVQRDWGWGPTIADPWVEICNGELTKKIIGVFTRAHDALKECGVG